MLIEEPLNILPEVFEPEVISVLYNNLNFITPVVSIGLAENEAQHHPLQTLHRWRYRRATDTRDKFYGLMGLLNPNWLVRTTCDYNLSAAQIFTRVTLDLLDFYGSLVPLCGMRGEKHATPDLPTWALDLVRPEILINEGCIFPRLTSVMPPTMHKS